MSTYQSLRNHESFFLIANLVHLCNRAMIEYDGLYRAGFLRLTIPEDILKILTPYLESRGFLQGNRFASGESKFCGIRMFSSVLDEIAITVVDISECERQLIIMKDFLEEKARLIPDNY